MAYKLWSVDSSLSNLINAGQGKFPSRGTQALHWKRKGFLAECEKELKHMPKLKDSLLEKRKIKDNIK